MNTFNRIALTGAVMLSGLFGMAGCAPMVPQELADARAAYQRAASGPAATLAPAEVHKAHESLALAERSFADKPEAQITRDLSYVAIRKSQLAEALGDQAESERKKAMADTQFQNKEVQIQQQTNNQLQQTRAQLSAAEQQQQKSAEQIEAERAARQQAEQRATSAEQEAADANARLKAAGDALAKLAAVKEDQRGMIITLSGSVLFASDQSVLLPEAQTRLAQVSDALMTTKERHIVVDGFTDSRGSDDHNLDLSQRRADAVRSYLVSRGYDPAKITAQGMGKDQPVASNSSAEGRANNRRVEIVIQPMVASN